jgi:putative DNA primase/helicase
MALTDLGNLERFLERYGADFLYVEAWGWLAWDGKRWNRDMAMALLGRRIQQTMRAIQDEADLIRDSGVPFPPEQGDIVDEDEAEALKIERDEEKEDYRRQLFDEGEKKRLNKRTVLWYRQRQLARQTKHDLPRHDYIAQLKSNGDIVLLSDKIAAWGRTSEGAGHISCIAAMAEARLAAKVEDFDSDELALNVQNGTILFARPAGDTPASFLLREHRREDRITKIARATYNAAATSPLFDAFLLRVQPADDMREFLDRWAGYSGLGLADAQKMALFYGEGQNGKGVWVQTHAHLLGDYAWSTGIETFMDADQKRNGGGPSPHLAALSGRRMVYANEPEDGSKFSDGLVKALTSDEPIGGVRELLKPPFEMTPTFNCTIMANNLPRIGTDHGIRRRMQVIPWGVIIPQEERDDQLKNKLKAEASGILNRLIRGALAFLTEGLNMPEASAEATRDYHEENDMLAMFLDLCIARSPGDKMQSGALHGLFVAWQTWAQQLPASGKAWSAKYLNAQMQRKGFKINKASTMQWHDIVARFDTIDFTDVDGKPTTRPLPAPRHADKPSAGKPPTGDAARPPAPPTPPDWSGDDDDLPP